MSWRNESHRHALAAHGIRTGAIPNLIVSRDWFDEDRYFNRKFVGSGLKNIDEDTVIDFVDNLTFQLNLLVRPDVEVESILVTGSRVSGFYKEDSDLDVYIVLKWPENEDKDRWMESEYSTMIIDTIEDIKYDMRFTKSNVIFDNKGNHIVVDVDFGWDDPLESEYPKPYIKIWEAP